MKCFYVVLKYASRYHGYVFHETRGKAKASALEQLHDAGWTQAKFIDIKANREPNLDKYFIYGETGTVFDYNQVLSGGR